MVYWGDKMRLTQDQATKKYEELKQLAKAHGWRVRRFPHEAGTSVCIYKEGQKVCASVPWHKDAKEGGYTLPYNRITNRLNDLRGVILE